MSRLLSTLSLAVILAASATPARADKLPADAKAVLDKAEMIEVYSLDPAAREGVKDGFHGWKVLGKVAVKKADRKALIEAIEKGAAGGDKPAKCFEPRHGIRAVDSTKTVDLVICYQCGFMYAFHGKDKQTTVLTSRASAPALNKILTAAKIPLAKE
jgi:hypothetical protein